MFYLMDWAQCSSPLPLANMEPPSTQEPRVTSRSSRDLLWNNNINKRISRYLKFYRYFSIK